MVGGSLISTGEAEDVKERLLNQVVGAGICVGCGACVAGVDASVGETVRTISGVVPRFADDAVLDELFWEACPGKGVDYPALYRAHYGGLPDDWRLGVVRGMWVGHAAAHDIRRAGASGGVTTAVLIHLLETKRIDAAILVRQGVPTPAAAGFVIARSREEILACAQSVYIPVSVLDSLRHLVPGERYAMTCLPEQSAALRVLQYGGHLPAKQVKYVLGPYTGTALDEGAIRALLRINGVSDSDAIASLEWRAGEWPGYLQVHTGSGRTIQTRKVYYNYLIPFYVTQASLQSMDFANDFADLSVGDAWSPKYEGLGKGFSVVVARSPEMRGILEEMSSAAKLVLEPVAVVEACAMHGHMIDFKRRGGYLRNAGRRLVGRSAPDYGLRPAPIGVSRILVEVVISSIFAVCRSSPARWCLERIPERVSGPLFNRLRLAWKSASRPTKRKGLGALKMETYTPAWKNRHE
jgi:coenzyme F420 hydrogenase subunit beta